MITRRLALFTALSAFGGAVSHDAVATPLPNDPLAIVNAIYARVISGDGDLGGAFMLENRARPKYFSKSLLALWAKSDAHGQGAIDFDPATNSQDPSVKSFAAVPEKMDVGLATIAVTLQPRLGKPPAHAEDQVIRYDFVRDGRHWKIDDIRGAIDAKPWSMRKNLARSLKE